MSGFDLIGEDDGLLMDWVCWVVIFGLMAFAVIVLFVIVFAASTIYVFLVDGDLYSWTHEGWIIPMAILAFGLANAEERSKWPFGFRWNVPSVWGCILCLLPPILLHIAFIVFRVMHFGAAAEYALELRYISWLGIPFFAVYYLWRWKNRRIRTDINARKRNSVPTMPPRRRVGPPDLRVVGRNKK